MKKAILLLASMLFLNLSAFPGVFRGSQDSIRTTLPRFLSAKTSHGMVLPTNDFVSGDLFIPYYNSISLKYGIAARGDYWQEYAFGMPYMGVGISRTNYFRKDDLGQPLTVFLFQGGHLTDFTKKVTLNYEWNAGAAFNWKPYDPFDNPNNVAIGSPVNIYAGVNIFLKWKLDKKIDLNVGAEFEHFSNGAFKYPNAGINQTSVFVELAYYINRNRAIYTPAEYQYPAFTKKKEHDIMFLISSHHARLDTLGTGLADKYAQRNFVVLGTSYAYMFNNHYRYRWGPSVEFTYDESAGVQSWREYNPLDGRIYDRVKLGEFGKRFSLGVSMKGEVKMPLYSAFLNIGYDILHADVNASRLYQIFGIKAPLKENFFGVFGIRATNFGKSQYMFLNFGYTIKREERKKEVIL